MRRLYYRIKYILTKKSPINSIIKQLIPLKYNRFFYEKDYSDNIIFDTYKFSKVRECTYQ